jgi:hypothetical protein
MIPMRNLSKLLQKGLIISKTIQPAIAIVLQV